jgi:hypothetical protein
MGDTSSKQNKKKRKKSGSTESSVKRQNTGVTTVMELVDQSTVTTLPPPTNPIETTPLVITMPDVQGPLKNVVQDVPKPAKGSLGSLLMETGSVDELIPKEQNAWPSVAKRLKDVFLTYQKTLPNKKDRTLPEEYTADLCTVYYSAAKGRVTKDGDDAEFCENNEVGDTVDFLETFMKANGQLDYIQRQNWYKSGDYVIGIDVNYYPDRSGYKVAPIFHKDTGGNNLFVNLVFDNQKPIEKTEWFADLAQPSKKRTEWQANLLPDGVLKDLDSTRSLLALMPEYAKDQPVKGGVTDDVNAYVSWVDDLVWHATPNNVPRLVFNEKVANNTYTNWNKAASKDNFSYASKQYGRTMLGAELLGTMAEAKGTALAQWLAARELGSQDLDINLAKQAWADLYSPEAGGKDLFLKDADIRANMAEWRITGENSEATAPDKDRLPGSKSIKETPQTLSTRRRANSLNPESIEKVRKANEKVERSFLRTWVRVLPRTSDEAVKSGVV